MYYYICQKLNCQKNVLRVYANYEYSFLRVKSINGSYNHNINIGNYIKNINNEYSINIRKDINLINTYLGNDIINSNEIILPDESLLSNWQKFKLFFTANNIDYITVNCGWDVNEDNEHFLINPITGEKTIINN